MNDPRLKILKWPDDLHHILDCLVRATHQEFVEFPTDSGETLRRPRTSPMPVFTGTATLCRSEKSVLDRFFDASRGHHYSFTDPSTGMTVYATFLRQPALKRQQIEVGRSETFEVELFLRDTTGMIQQALEHGVVSDD